MDQLEINSLRCPKCNAEVHENIICNRCGLYFVTPNSWPQPTEEFIEYNQDFFKDHYLQWI